MIVLLKIDVDNHQSFFFFKKKRFGYHLCLMEAIMTGALS
jgi:hypothetical protein